MALMLVQKKTSGEPVGIWLQDGKNYYRTAAAGLQIAAEARVGQRNPNFPWDTFVDELTHSAPHRYAWDSVNSTQPMDVTLDNEYDKWTAMESGAQVLDKD